MLLEPSLKTVKPIQILGLADIQTELDLVQELHLHDVDLLDVDSCYIRPGLVGERVVV